MSESKDQSTDSTGSPGLQSRGEPQPPSFKEKDTSIFLFEKDWQIGHHIYRKFMTIPLELFLQL